MCQVSKKEQVFTQFLSNTYLLQPYGFFFKSQVSKMIYKEQQSKVKNKECKTLHV